MNTELQQFHGNQIKNFSISLTSVLSSDLFNVTTVKADSIYKIIPLFYCKTITSSNPEDKILDDKCIIALKQTGETFYTFTSNDDDGVEDYQDYGTYYEIGDDLTTNQYNSIVCLLRHNIRNSDKLRLKNGTITGVYGEYTFDLEGVTVIDKGILVTDETISNLGTVELTNTSFEHSSYTLELKVLHMTDINLCDDVNTDNIVTETLNVDLVEDTEVTIPFTQLSYDYIVLFDAEIIISHDKPIIEEA